MSVMFGTMEIVSGTQSKNNATDGDATRARAAPRPRRPGIRVDRMRREYVRRERARLARQRGQRGGRWSAASRGLLWRAFGWAPRLARALTPRSIVSRSVVAAIVGGLAPLLGCAIVALANCPGQSLVRRATLASRVAAFAWLTAHHVGLSFERGSFGVAPLGLTLLAGLALAAATGRACRSSAGPDESTPSPARVLVVVGTVTATYAGLVTVVAVLAGTDEIRVALPAAAVGGSLLAAVASGLSGCRVIGWRPVGAALLPDRGRPMLRGALAGFATLVGCAALLLAVSLGWHIRHAVALVTGLHPGFTGGLTVWLAGVLSLPNAIACALAFSVGPGFAVGAGTIVSPLWSQLGALPAFPLFAAVPGWSPVVGALSLLAPVLAGCAVGWLMRDSGHTARARSVGWEAAAAGLLVGCAVGVYASLAGGPLAGGRMATFGPSGWQVGLAVAAEVGGVAVATPWWLAAGAFVARLARHVWLARPRWHGGRLVAPTAAVGATVGMAVGVAVNQAPKADATSVDDELAEPSQPLPVHDDGASQHVGEGLASGVPENLEETEAAGQQVHRVQQSALYRLDGADRPAGTGVDQSGADHPLA